MFQGLHLDFRLYFGLRLVPHFSLCEKPLSLAKPRLTFASLAMTRILTFKTKSNQISHLNPQATKNGSFFAPFFVASFLRCCPKTTRPCGAVARPCRSIFCLFRCCHSFPPFCDYFLRRFLSPSFWAAERQPPRLFLLSPPIAPRLFGVFVAIVPPLCEMY